MPTCREPIPRGTTECGSTDCTDPFFTSFSSTYNIARGKSAQFRFYNYNHGGDNWNNWVMICTNGKDSHGGGGTEYFAVRADAYGWGNTNYKADNIVHDYNGSTFMSDMNGALVDITVQYEKSGKVTMSSTTTTQSGQVYNYSYWQNSITAAQIGIFFTIEKAYISSVGPNGESLGIQEVQSDEAPLHEGIYDLYGRPMDQLRPGLNIVNGRKVIIR